jgi:N-carbamoylputrescine amidase
MGEMENIGAPDSLTTVACIQFEPKVGRKEENIAATRRLVEEAAQRGATLCVLPELCNSGYVFESREEALELAEEIPHGPTAQAWIEMARAHGLCIVAGIAERVEKHLYNSAVLIRPDGQVSTYRKMHLWHREKLFFEPGNLGFPVFSTPLGHVGMAICYDIWFPEATRILAMRGADIICVPTNWVPMPGQPSEERPMAIYLCMATAHVNAVFVAAADRTGIERGQRFLGNSVVVGPSGWPVAGPASANGEEIVYATCNLTDSRRMKAMNELNDIARDRRIDVYDPLLGVEV